MRENEFSGNSLESVEISVVVEQLIEPHLSCMINQKETTKESGQYEITQSQLQQILDKKIVVL